VEVPGVYTSAVLLSMMAFLVLIEALLKFINRVAVKYEEALLIAFGGLLVNLISAFVLSHEEDHKYDFDLKSAYLHVFTDTLALPMQSFQSLLDVHCGTDGRNPEDGKDFKTLSIVQQVLKVVILSSCKGARDRVRKELVPLSAGGDGPDGGIFETASQILLIKKYNNVNIYIAG
jgi:hypothetical protein